MCHPYVLGWRARWGVLAVAALLAGCGMPSSMEVRTANEPKYEDDHVRFRTTYFFASSIIATCPARRRPIRPTSGPIPFIASG